MLYPTYYSEFDNSAQCVLAPTLDELEELSFLDDNIDELNFLGEEDIWN